MKESRRLGRCGFTVVELLIFSGISLFALLSVAEFLKKPTQMQQVMASSEMPREAVHAMDLLVNDLKNAAPGTLQWDVLSSTTPLTFAMTRLDPQTGKIEPVSLTYGYEGPEGGPGNLVRVESITPTVILKSIDRPTEEAPIFQYDSVLHVLMVDIRYHPAGRPAMRLVRRVALSQ